MSTLKSANQLVFKNSRTDTFEMLKCLAFDDDYRAQFEKNPEKALARFNIFVPDGINFEASKLPDKEQMQSIMTDLALGKPVQSLRVPNGEPQVIWVFIVFIAFLAFFSH